MNTGAEISPCQKYRYALWRIWDEARPLALFVGLNPSTANETEDDPTIRRCVGFAKRWQMGGILVGNLFAYRSVDPDKLVTKHDAVGPQNDAALLKLQNRASITVAMWGSHPIAVQRAHAVCRLLGNLRCLAVNEDGQPRHILYVPYKTELRQYEWNVGRQG